MDEKTLMGYVQELLARIRIANSYRIQYKTLCDEGNSYNNAVKTAPCFIQLVSRAFCHAIMIDLCKLYEDSKEVISVPKIINICEQNAFLFLISPENELLLVKERMGKNEKAIANLKVQRDKIWAHSDKKYAQNPKEVEDSYPINWGEVEDLLSIAGDCVNIVKLRLTNGEIDDREYRYTNADDVKRLLAAAEAGLTALS